MAAMAEPSRRSGGLAAWKWPIVALVVAGLVTWAYFAALERFVAAGRALFAAPGDVVAGLERAARGVLTGDVTYRFLSSLPEVESPRGGNLELAVARTVETIERTDERRAFWDLVPLGSTTVGVRVPVTWRYHVPLSGTWKVTVTGDLMTVDAPRLRPSQPPAIHTDRLERQARADWLRFDAAERLAEIERALTPILAMRAGDARHLALVREPARRTLAEFARAWLVGQHAWGGAEVRAIAVRFADEPEADASVPVLVAGPTD
jgi:hypothetical protein